MIANMNSPITTIASFGISLMLLGGFLGSEIVKRRQMKEELLEIQKEQKATLQHMRETYEKALQYDQKVLVQIDSVYSTIALLNNQENKARTNVNTTKSKVEAQKIGIATTQKELAKAAKNSQVEFEN